MRKPKSDETRSFIKKVVSLTFYDKMLPDRKWIFELPWRAKQRAPCERALKTELKTGVKK